MIFSTTQDTYNFGNLDTVKRIGIKLSGGADSAGISYMIFKTIHDKKLDTEVVIITTEHNDKPYQRIYSNKVLVWLREEFPLVKVIAHISNNTDGMDYSDAQDIVLDRAYNEFKIERHYNGITQNPPRELSEQFEEEGMGEFDDTRFGHFAQWNGDYHHPGYRPFINTDKKGVASIYEQYNLLNTLFLETRSCEEVTLDFRKHCGKCWYCKEREWGFGKLD
jgi:hypothetical protein